MPIEFLTPMFPVTTEFGEFIARICHHFSFALCQHYRWILRLRQVISLSKNL